MTEIRSMLWFTPSPLASKCEPTSSGVHPCIGIVLVYDKQTKKHEARIGVGCGRVELLDAELIARHGARFPAEAARALFKTVDPRSITG